MKSVDRSGTSNVEIDDARGRLEQAIELHQMEPQEVQPSSICKYSATEGPLVEPGAYMCRRAMAFKMPLTPSRSIFHFPFPETCYGPLPAFHFNFAE